MRRAFSVLAITVAIGALSACGGSADSTSPESSVSTPPATYDSITALRDSFVEAGGDCPDFKQTNRVKFAAESADCSTDAVLSTYLSADAVQDRVDASKEAFASSDSSTWLVGQNWIINAPNPEALQKKMGGQLISWGDTTPLTTEERNFERYLLEDPEGFTSNDVRPALEIGQRICGIYDTGDHQEVLDYLIPMAEDQYTATELGAILGITTSTLCLEHAGKIPED